MVQGRHQVKSYKVHTIVPIPEEDWFWVENTHEAIIDQETYERAQELWNGMCVLPRKQKRCTCSPAFSAVEIASEA